jgi:hypothetical protein
MGDFSQIYLATLTAKDTYVLGKRANKRWLTRIHATYKMSINVDGEI